MKKIVNLQVESIFLLFGIVSISLMIFIMPINRVPDEANHARMSWQIVFPENEKSFQWMREIEDGDEISKKDYKQLFSKKIDLSNERFSFNFTLKNLVHIPQLVGMLFGSVIYPSVGIIFTFGRIMNALLYIVSMYFIIKSVMLGKEALCFISLLPIMIQQAASLSYDTMNFIAVSFSFLVFVEIIQKKVISTHLLKQIIFLVLLLYITKTNNIFLLILIFLTGFTFPNKYIKLNNYLDKFSFFLIKNSKIIIFTLSSLFLITSVIVFHFRGGIFNFVQVMINTLFNNNMNGHLNSILTIGMFGYIGNFCIQFPLWLVFINVLVIFMLMYINPNKIKINHFLGYGCVAMFFLQIIMIIGGMYFSWTPKVLGDEALISVGAQGRYFTPFLIFLAPFLISQADRAFFYMKPFVSKNILVYTTLLNIAIMFYLILSFYWFPSYQGNWLLKLRELVVN